SLSGTSKGYETMRDLARHVAADHDFADLDIPFVAMAADLDARLPVPIADGSLFEGLLAATALAGLFPAYERDGRRLVDGLALVPVRVDAVSEAGADVTIAINLMSRDTLDAWPGEAPAPLAPAGGRQRMLEVLLEVMDLTQLDASVQHAA